MTDKKKIKIEFRWEQIGRYSENAYRARVVGGWVFCGSSGICFIPDPEHLWEV